MAKKYLADKSQFYINGHQQKYVESITIDEVGPLFEEIKVLESPYPKRRFIKHMGNGSLTWIMNDEDDGYGPGELISYIIGYNDFNDTTDTWEITNLDLSVDATTGDMIRYLVDRQNDSSGASVTITYGGSAATTMTYTTRGEELNRIALDIESEAVGAGARISVQSTASSDTSYIRNSDLSGASGMTWFDLYNTGETAIDSITTYSGTHDPEATDTLTITIIDGSASETVELDRNLAADNLWYMVRMYNANHLDISIRQYDTGGTNYIKWDLDRVFMEGSSVAIEPSKSPRVTVKFTFEGIAFGSG